jgi:hypothetical protein
VTRRIGVRVAIGLLGILVLLALAWVLLLYFLGS